MLLHDSLALGLHQVLTGLPAAGNHYLLQAHGGHVAGTARGPVLLWLNTSTARYLVLGADELRVDTRLGGQWVPVCLAYSQIWLLLHVQDGADGYPHSRRATSLLPASRAKLALATGLGALVGAGLCLPLPLLRWPMVVLSLLVLLVAPLVWPPAWAWPEYNVLTPTNGLLPRHAYRSQARGLLTLAGLWAVLVAGSALLLSLALFSPSSRAFILWRA